jgi:hypothetical protein
MEDASPRKKMGGYVILGCKPTSTTVRVVRTTNSATVPKFTWRKNEAILGNILLLLR